MGDAAKALASLSAETKAALDSGLESVKQGRPELRLIWEQAAVKQADGETTMAATTVAVTANESLPEKARRLYNEEGYTQKQVAQHVNRSDRTVRRWFNGK
jgi:DNA-binding XRE family transcriptional regulator